MNGLIKCFNKECNYFDSDRPDHCSKPLHKILKCYKSIIRKDGKSKNWYYDELQKNECACGRNKRPGNSFCYPDYRLLPPELQKALYQPIGNGYEEAYEAAHKWLEENIW